MLSPSIRKFDHELTPSGLSNSPCRPALAICVWLSVMLASAYCSEAPDPEVAGKYPVIRADEGGRVIVEDGANGYRLSLPGAYWQCKTASRMASEVPARGCSGAGGAMPPGLLLVVQNKDAPAVASLELLPERFLMRGRADLENYMEQRHRLLKERGGAAVEFGPSSYSERDGMIIPRATFTVSARDQGQKYLLVHFFVRPKGEDARIYQLACIALEGDFERLREDFEHIAASFRFTGQVAAEFFVPDAPAERLPTARQPSSRVPACGGGYVGMLFAMLIVFAVYWMIRRRSSRPQV